MGRPVQSWVVRTVKPSMPPVHALARILEVRAIPRELFAGTSVVEVGSR